MLRALLMVRWKVRNSCTRSRLRNQKKISIVNLRLVQNKLRVEASSHGHSLSISKLKQGESVRAIVAPESLAIISRMNQNSRHCFV